jgi:hypothetical protein
MPKNLEKIKKNITQKEKPCLKIQTGAKSQRDKENN